jgi:hypothetical protein
MDLGLFGDLPFTLSITLDPGGTEYRAQTALGAIFPGGT